MTLERLMPWPMLCVVEQGKILRNRQSLPLALFLR